MDKIWAAVAPYLGWIILGGVVLLVLLAAALLIRRYIVRRRYDKALEAEMHADAAREAPSALDAEVTVIPQEELPRDKNSFFMPVPGKISDFVDFVSEARDGLTIRSCVRCEDANELLTHAEAEELKAVVWREVSESDACFYISTEDLSLNFAPYSYVNLEILKKFGLADASTTSLAVRAEGVMRKPLMVEANAFSPDAVKMISLVGGRALEIKSGSSRK